MLKGMEFMSLIGTSVVKTFIVTTKLNCIVASLSEYDNSHTVKKGLRPNFFFKNHFHTGVIAECDEAIEPGKVGILRAKFILDEPSLPFLSEGCDVGIYEGPENKLASCRVLKVEDIEPLSEE